MLKKLEQLTHEENLLLLELVATGEVDENTINGNVRFATEYSDYFLGLDPVSNRVTDDQYEKITVICLGESRVARDLMEKIGGIELVDNVDSVATVTETIRMARPNFK